MDIAISNLAFDIEDIDFLNQIKDLNIKMIEIAPTIISDWDILDIEKLDSYLKTLKSHNMSCYSMQSIFYKTNFKNLNQTESIINHFNKLVTICNHMNIKKIIFGSPFIRKNWTKDTIKLFHSIDNILENCDVEFLIEPNSKNYGFEYFFTVEEIYKFIKFNKFNNIKTMIDTHNILLSNCNPMEDLEAYFEMISHIHISENKLSPIIESDFHYEFSNKIKELKYDKVVTYEVLKNKNINLDKFIDIYS